MKRPHSVGLAFLATALLTVRLAHGHALNPLYCGSGLYSLAIVSSWAAIVVFPGLLLVHAYVLQVLVSVGRSAGEIVRRAVAIFFFSKVAECVAGVMFTGAAWRESSAAETVFICALQSIAGLSVNMLCIAGIFRSDGAGPARVAAAGLALSVTSYVILLLANCVMITGW